jgi:uncharacterized repeat protein (TIGR03803 family)
MSPTRLPLLAAVTSLSLSPTPGSAQVVTILHSLTGSPNDGSDARAFLYLSGTTLFGMTAGGGANGDGTIFRIGLDGSGYSITHTFNAGVTDGGTPSGSLIGWGGNLYGTTEFGGSGNAGTVFSLGVYGSNYGLLHSFPSGAADGSHPLGTLAQSGATLYGFTSTGGAANLGTVFKISIDGTGYALLHTFTGSFSGGTADGGSPNGGAPVISGSTMYCMTPVGGSSGGGVIFKMNLDGSGFTVLHNFVGGAADGLGPQGQLVVSGSVIYGMAGSGGSRNDGVIFKLNTDGTGFTLLHTFLGGPSDGAAPQGDLALDGTTLYGTTVRGGVSALGTLISVNTDGSDFELLHSFAGGLTDGSFPIGGVTVANGDLYGLADGGGPSNDGVVFSFPIAEPSPLLLIGAAGSMLAMTRREREAPAQPKEQPLR